MFIKNKNGGDTTITKSLEKNTGLPQNEAIKSIESVFRETMDI